MFGSALWWNGDKGLGSCWMLCGELGMAVADGKVPCCGIT